MSGYKRYPKYRDSGVEWIGEVPEGWNVCKLAYRFSVDLGKMLDQKRITGEHLVRYLRNQDVQWGHICTDNLPLMDIAPEEFQRYTAISGDLLVCEGGDVGRAAIWRGDRVGYQKALHRLRALANDSVSFMFYLLTAAKAQGLFSESDSKSTISHLPAEQFRVHRFPFPPVAEQTAIAAYLDRATVCIDALVAKKAHFIALLKEKRQALITHAVTKGLNPNAKMKDSGVEWIGEVPEGWEVVPSTWLFSEGKTRAYADDQHLSATQKYGVIPLIDYERLEERQVTHAILHHDQRKHVEPGDFVISMRSFEGGIERVNARGCVRSSYVVLHAENSVAIDFFTFLFKSSSYIQGLQATSNFIRDGQDLNYGNFRQVKLPRPKLEEQQHIAEFLTTSINRIDQIKVKIERSIALLQEKRLALITAAVTGKILVGDGA